MSVKLLLTTADKDESVVDTSSIKRFESLGDSIQQDLAFDLKELFGAVVSELTDSITSESTLTLEISGSVNFKGQGDAKFLVFNVGGETSRTNQMKVTLSTSIQPSV